MKLVGYEFKKMLRGRYVPVLLAVLMAIMGALSFVRATEVKKERQNTELMITVYEDYLSSPEDITNYLKEIEAFEEEQSRLFLDAVLSGNEESYEPVKKTWKYTASTSANAEKALLYEVISAKIENEDYINSIEKVIETNERKLLGYEANGIAKDSFLYGYTEYTISVYKNFLEKQITPDFEYTYGWQDYFEYSEGNILPFLGIIVVVSAIFLGDKSCGFYFVMSVQKNGRGKSIKAKIILSVLLSIVISILFSLISFGVFHGVLGMSNHKNAVQALESFRFVPYELTIFEYFCLFVFFKALVLSFFSGAVAVLSSFLNNYAAVYFLSSGLIGANIFIYAYNNLNNTGFLKVNNLFSLYGVNGLFSRVRAYDVFGCVWDNLAIIIPALVLLFGMFVFGIYLSYHSKSSARTYNFKLPVCFEKILKRNRKKKRYVGSVNVFNYEAYKMFSSVWIIIAAAVCMLGCLYISQNRYDVEMSYTDAVYNNYMDILSGEASVEKTEFIKSERARINDIISKKPSMQEKYASKEISGAEYSDYMEEYYNAEALSEAFRVVEARAFEIDEYKLKNGRNIWFVHELGYDIYFGNFFNIPLFALIIILCFGVFTVEYKSNSRGGSFYVIMSSTKKGRAKTFGMKYALSTVTVLPIFALAEGAELYFFSQKFNFTELSAPVASIDRFYSVSSDLTIGGYLALSIFIRLVGTLLLVYLTLCVSQLVKRVIPSLALVSIITLVPYIGWTFGGRILKIIDFTGVFDSNSLFEYSAELTGTSAVYFTVISAFVVITAGACAISFCKFNKIHLRHNVKGRDKI